MGIARCCVRCRREGTRGRVPYLKHMPSRGRPGRKKCEVRFELLSLQTSPLSASDLCPGSYPLRVETSTMTKITLQCGRKKADVSLQLRNIIFI